ncbi:MAG: hypothetical protein R8L58_02390 [Mariprofundaceae bacterium]
MDSPDLATIMLGAYRMQARVPPNTPLGHIWLELMNREIPAQMRILSETRALQLLIRKIADQVQGSSPNQSAASPRASAHTAVQSESGWPMSASMQLPFSLHVSQDQERLLLEQADDESPRGMIQKQVDADRYALHGRLDLDHLDTLFFMLEQRGEQAMQLKLRAGSHQAFLALQQPFEKFLAAHNDATQEAEEAAPLQGRLFEGNEPFLKPARKQGTLA